MVTICSNHGSSSAADPSADQADPWTAPRNRRCYFGTGEAERRLAGRPDGTFLIRFSSSQPGSYTISKVKRGGSPVHQRIEHKKDQFHIGSRHYASLEQLLAAEHGNMSLVTACPGSKYRTIFEDNSASGSYYVDPGDEERSDEDF